MTTHRDTPASRRVRANGDGTVYQRKDSRWEAAGYVLAPGNTHKLLSPLTLTYIPSVLKSALEHAVREEEIPRNVARNVRTGTPRPRRFEPLTAEEARQFLTTAQNHRLHALFELALHTGLRKC